MPFHTTASGAIQPCTATVRSCPLASPEDHYANFRDANYALTMEQLEHQVDFMLALPEDFGKLVPAAPADGASTLSAADFVAFQRSDANKPTQVQDDWRETIARNAQLNGDAHADAHPDTSYSSDYYEPDFDSED